MALKNKDQKTVLIAPRPHVPMGTRGQKKKKNMYCFWLWYPSGRWLFSWTFFIVLLKVRVSVPMDMDAP